LADEGALLFDYIEQERITHFGVSARFIDAIAKNGLSPTHTHDLSTLRTIFSTGSPLSPESFDYVYGHVKADVQLASVSGGTDIISAFVLGNPLLPVRRGEIQCRGLGMAVDVFDEHGQTVRGEKGELVCTKAFPSMPLGMTRKALNIVRLTSKNSPALGSMEIMRRSQRMTASLSTAVQMLRSIQAVSASAQLRFTGRWNNCPRYWNR
jgi:acyl-coenzyme A synthetase/AMP-(fatty) acid ligase